MSSHILKPRPPVRAFAIAAGLAAIGAAVVVGAAGMLWLQFAGIVLLAGSAVLLGCGVLAMHRMRVEVVLDATGYQVVTPAGTQSGRWPNVSRVSRAEGQVILYDKTGRRTVIALPRGGAGDLDALGTEIAHRLDTDRGYLRR